MRKMLIFLVLLLLLCLPCSAAWEEGYSLQDLPPEYADMLTQLPEAVRSSLPQELFSPNAAEQAEALERFLTPVGVLEYLLEMLLSDLSAPLSCLAGILGVLLLRSLLDCMATGLGSGVSPAFSLLCRLCFCTVLSAQAVTLLSGVCAYFEALGQLIHAYVPLMSAMYLWGGNVAVATVNQSTLIFATSLVSTLGGATVVPLFSICLALTLVGTVEGASGSKTAHISGKLKKWYTTALALTMLLLSAILAAQTTLAARADSLTFKTVRFVVSSNIPLVGGGVAEMLRSAATGVSWLRSLVGVGGVVMLLSLLLPTIARVLLCRWVCTLGADAAAWFGCPEEGRLLSELGGLHGYLLAVVSLCSVTFFFSLILLLQCATAL
jgi:stage III sporulation protein AE